MNLRKIASFCVTSTVAIVAILLFGAPDWVAFVGGLIYAQLCAIEDAIEEAGRMK